MQTLQAFAHGDGAHCGLSDWYDEQEQALKDALAAHEPFDTGWYSSKKEIASARIWSKNGQKLQVEVSVSDDFDTIGTGYEVAEEWSLEGVDRAISRAWEKADADRESNQEYCGFSVLKHSGKSAAWEETYLINIGWSENLEPSGDNYHWWGWQHDGTDEGQGIPHPDIPVTTVTEFEKWAHNWAFGRLEGEQKSLRIGNWEIKPWNDDPPSVPEDPNDYIGMGWVDSRGRP